MKIVIKVGTSTLVNEETNEFRTDILERLCRQIANIRTAGHTVTLVTSGACGLGRSELLKSEDEQTRMLANDKQQCAIVGQPSLMALYKQEFIKHNIIAGQTLLAGRQDFGREITHSALHKSMDNGLLQIINANDAVYDEQMRIGDNDTLSAEVAKLLEADRLLLVTDEVGFFENYKDEKLRKLVTNANARQINNLYKHVEMDSGSKGGTGKMKTKLDAAKTATRSGCDVDIVSNSEIDNLLRIIEGDCSVQTTHFEKSHAKNKFQQFLWNIKDDCVILS